MRSIIAHTFYSFDFFVYYFIKLSLSYCDLCFLVRLLGIIIVADTVAIAAGDELICDFNNLACMRLGYFNFLTRKMLAFTKILLTYDCQ